MKYINNTRLKMYSNNIQLGYYLAGLIEVQKLKDSMNNTRVNFKYSLKRAQVNGKPIDFHSNIVDSISAARIYVGL